MKKEEMPMNLAVSNNKNLLEEMWFKMAEVDKFEYCHFLMSGEDQCHLRT